jgi:hypothetical protein
MSNKISSFTPEILDQLRVRIQTNLNDIGIEFGISFRIGGMTYTKDKVTARLSATVDREGKRVPEMVYDFNVYCYDYGAIPEDLGKELTIEGTKYLLVGLKPRASKRPFVCQRVSDGVQFNFIEKPIRELLGHSEENLSRAFRPSKIGG